MAVAHQSLGSIGYGARTDTVIPAPSGIVNGDILLIVFLIGEDPTLPAATPPTGFDEPSGYPNVGVVVHNPADGGTGKQTLWVWWKRASSESGSYTVTHIIANTEAVCIRYNGALASGDPTADPNATSNKAQNNSTITALGGATATNGNMVIFASGTWNDMPAATPPSGTTPTFTERYDPSGTSQLYIADGPLTTAGATGDKTITGPAALGWEATLIFLQAATTARPQTLGLLGVG